MDHMEPIEPRSDRLPSGDGWYADSGGYLWALDDGGWRFYGQPSDPQPRSAPDRFAPFTRMLPERHVDGMLGDRDDTVERRIALAQKERDELENLRAFVAALILRDGPLEIDASYVTQLAVRPEQWRVTMYRQFPPDAFTARLEDREVGQ